MSVLVGQFWTLNLSATQIDRSINLFPALGQVTLDSCSRNWQKNCWADLSRKVVINLLANNCDAFRYYRCKYPRGTSVLFIAFVFAWNCQLQKVPDVKWEIERRWLIAITTSNNVWYFSFKLAFEQWLCQKRHLSVSPFCCSEIIVFEFLGLPAIKAWHEILKRTTEKLIVFRFCKHCNLKGADSDGCLFKNRKCLFCLPNQSIFFYSLLFVKYSIHNPFSKSPTFCFKCMCFPWNIVLSRSILKFLILSIGCVHHALLSGFKF